MLLPAPLGAISPTSSPDSSIRDTFSSVQGQGGTHVEGEAHDPSEAGLAADPHIWRKAGDNGAIHVGRQHLHDCERPGRHLY